MPIRRSQLLVKWIFENQHKLRTVRRCSSSLRYKELEEAAVAAPEYAPPVHDEPCPHGEPEQYFKYEDLHVKLAAPYQLQPKPDAKDLGFGKYFTDHMLKINYQVQLGGWQKPDIIPFENLSIHPAAKALHYAIQLFEGMKAYRGVDDKIRLFRPDLNMKRMNLAAHRSGLPIFNGEELIKCMKRLIQIDQEWVPHSESSTLYIRPTLIATEATFGVMAPESALLFVVLSPVSAYYKTSTDGAVSIFADPNVVRAFPGGVGNRKVGSNYGPTIEATTRAAQLGHHQVLWLFGPDHQLTEVGAMNIFMVYINENGVVTRRQAAKHAAPERADPAGHHAPLHPRAGQPVGRPGRQGGGHHHGPSHQSQQTGKATGDVRRGYGGGDQPRQPDRLPRGQHPHPHHAPVPARVPAAKGHPPGHPVRPHRPPLLSHHLIVT
ncbi:branched-chain-amino-acid aminotransferase, cytosolic isoform X1 [Cydia strobilella]|uniref:branched-chain-amino-acid aminotransferase, cytosolic isoform X1 n=1 Tax=Cydia strobilella TaxID=1100964 RepID=UPI00300653B2